MMRQQIQMLQALAKAYDEQANIADHQDLGNIQMLRHHARAHRAAAAELDATDRAMSTIQANEP